jgi:hypothetical protein
VREGDLGVKILRGLAYGALYASVVGGVLDGGGWPWNGCVAIPTELAPNCEAGPATWVDSVAATLRRRVEGLLASDSAGFNIECTPRSLDGPDVLQSSPDGAV